VPDGDALRCFWISNPEFGKVLLYRCIELNFAGLDQLHDRQCCERFAHRPDLEGRLHRHGTFVFLGGAERLQVDDLSVLDDAKRRTRHSKIIESSTHVVVDCIELRVGLRGRLLQVYRRQRRQNRSEADDQRRDDQAGDSSLAFHDHSPYEGCWWL
jgi:hypothetical protein